MVRYIISCLLVFAIGILIGQWLQIPGSIQVSFWPPKKEARSSFLKDPNYEESVYYGKRKAPFSVNTWKTVQNKIKRLEIFYHPHTKVQFPENNKFIKEDLLVSVTIKNGPLYITSYERVSTYHESNDELLVVLSAASENLIDGYYRILLTPIQF